MFQPSSDLYSSTDSRKTRTETHFGRQLEIIQRVAEGDKREVREANVTTVSISSKLDLFLSALCKTLRFCVFVTLELHV